MTETGKLKASWLKIGGSPLYYIDGQEQLLENFSDSLQEKDKRAYDLLKQHKVIADIDLNPLFRVAMRNLHDFAKPLTVTIDNTPYQFWKWHDVALEEANALIERRISSEQEHKQQPTPEHIDQKEHKEQKQKKEKQTTIEKREQETAAQGTTPITEKKVDGEQTTHAPPAQQQPQKTKKERARKEEQSAFEETIEAYFKNNNISVISKTVIKKNSDIEYLITLPSVFGNLPFYCRARNKKKILESDISSIFVQGQLKKLPVIILAPGELNKKAAEMLTTVQAVTFARVK